MAIQRYIQIDGFFYIAVDDQSSLSDRPTTRRLKTYGVSLSGKSIIQDFTINDYHDQFWSFRLRPYTTTAELPGYGLLSDLETAYKKITVPFVEFDDALTHTVTFLGEFAPIPRVGANVAGDCNGIHYVQVHLQKVYT